jgi:chromosome segregation ATPase
MEVEEEEIALLEEQLAAAHADIERLQEQVAEAAARAGTHESEALTLRRELASARERIAAFEAASAAQAEEVETLRSTLSASAEAARSAAGRYRELLLKAEPSLPADLVAGDDVDAVDAAAERARQTVAQVRQHLEHQAQAIRVPAGAPRRSEPDAGDLTPAEKIRLGLEQR